MKRPARMGELENPTREKYLDYIENSKNSTVKKKSKIRKCGGKKKTGKNMNRYFTKENIQMKIYVRG